jgi:hypothetical protein
LVRNANRHLSAKRFSVIQSHRFRHESLSIGVDRLTKPIKLALQPLVLRHRPLQQRFLHKFVFGVPLVGAGETQSIYNAALSSQRRKSGFRPGFGRALCGGALFSGFDCCGSGCCFWSLDGAGESVLLIMILLPLQS